MLPQIMEYELTIYIFSFVKWLSYKIPFKNNIVNRFSIFLLLQTHNSKISSFPSSASFELRQLSPCCLHGKQNTVIKKCFFTFSIGLLIMKISCSKQYCYFVSFFNILHIWPKDLSPLVGAFLHLSKLGNTAEQFFQCRFSCQFI